MIELIEFSSNTEERENARNILSHIIRRANHLYNGEHYMEILLSETTIQKFFNLLKVF